MRKSILISAQVYREQRKVPETKTEFRTAVIPEKNKFCTVGEQTDLNHGKMYNAVEKLLQLMAVRCVK